MIGDKKVYVVGAKTKQVALGNMGVGQVFGDKSRTMKVVSVSQQYKDNDGRWVVDIEAVEIEKVTSATAGK